jgi:hypothetical protein
VPRVTAIERHALLAAFGEAMNEHALAKPTPPDLSAEPRKKGLEPHVRDPRMLSWRSDSTAKSMAIDPSRICISRQAASGIRQHLISGQRHGTLRVGLAYPRLDEGVHQPPSGLGYMRTLKASLSASVIGTGAWMLGLTDKMWPAHPQWAAFFLTIGATTVLMYALPRPRR